MSMRDLWRWTWYEGVWACGAAIPNYIHAEFEKRSRVGVYIQAEWNCFYSLFEHMLHTWYHPCSSLFDLGVHRPAFFSLQSACHLVVVIKYRLVPVCCFDYCVCSVKVYDASACQAVILCLLMQNPECWIG